MPEAGGNGGDESRRPSGDAMTLSPIKVGMLTFLVSEAAFFGTLVMTYICFLREMAHGQPSPGQVFRLPGVLAASACLLSSSATVHKAERAMRRDAYRSFLGWWGITIALGVIFLLATAFEWSNLIRTWGLTISRNLFGTNYFTLVGFHALHVSIGVIVMMIVFDLARRRQITARNKAAVEVVSWYWHFVDGVWVVVFTLVYVVGR